MLLIAFVLLAGLSCQNKQTAPASQPTPPAGEPTPPAADKEPQQNKKLDLSNKGLEKIPSYVFSQADLEELSASNNRITGAIQAEIRQLQKLKVLNLSNNLMTGVPAEIGQLKNLEILDLSNNQLTGLPYELGNLKNLKTLNISGNDYSKLDLGIIKQNLPLSVKIIGEENQPPADSGQNKSTGVNVNIENFSFNPATLNIKTGTTVKWTNKDSVGHSIKSDKINSKILQKDESFEFAFSETGAYDYICGPHPFMKGKIIVE